eukprot:TRINITY_DN9359_c0_g2_i1.p1 TRINITY_DN9359_c0_g2~~TRINITY_DN9359_c0_g2_i1.p1  ORF type:complete len:132 (+),score=5.51 TRINITY_DN9359_c0_g2_i1:141-536(+)
MILFQAREDGGTNARVSLCLIRPRYGCRRGYLISALEEKLRGDQRKGLAKLPRVIIWQSRGQSGCIVTSGKAGDCRQSLHDLTNRPCAILHDGRMSGTGRRGWEGREGGSSQGEPLFSSREPRKRWMNTHT